MSCRTGCPTKDHLLWCTRRDPRQRRQYFRDLRSRGLWRCTEHGAELPIDQFYLRSSGQPVTSLCKEHYSAFGRKMKVKYQYGMSQEGLDALLASQGGLCAICRLAEPGADGSWRIDHDHSCCPGKRSCGACVRGLLCNNCNVGIGMFRDSPEFLMRGAEYLGMQIGMPRQVA